METAKKHIGRNIARIREMRGMKQESLAELLGVTQQKISLYENAEELDDSKLEPIAKALGLSAQTLRDFSEDAFFNVISNTFTSNDDSTLNAINPYCTFNPIDKMVELYERMLQQQKEMIDRLEKLLQK